MTHTDRNIHQDVVGYVWSGEILHQACLVERMVDAGELAPAARDDAVADVLHQYEAYAGGEVELPSPLFVGQDDNSGTEARRASTCDRCLTTLADEPLLTHTEARTVAAGWVGPDAPGLTAFATGHANATALLDDAISEVEALRVPDGGHARELVRLHAHLTAQLPYFVVTVSDDEPHVARGVRAAREYLAEELEQSTDATLSAVPSPVLSVYDAHGRDAAVDYAAHVYDYDRGDAVASRELTLELLDELAQLDTLLADLACLASRDLVRGVALHAGRLVYEASPRTRAELEADGWVFTAEGEVDHDALPY